MGELAEAKSGLSGRVIQVVALSIVAVASWLGAVYFRIAPDGSPLLRAGRAAVETSGSPSSTASATAAVTASASSTAAAPSVSVTATATSATPTATATASTAAPVASAVPTASSEASAEPAADGDAVLACVAKMFPKDTFASDDVDFSFICKATDPRKGITEVQAQVVAGRGGRGGVTKGMRSWSHLNWYRLAAFAVMRGRCCASTPDLEWSMELPCPFHEAIAKVEAAARAKDKTALEGALGYYTTTARCLGKAGMSRAFDFAGAPGAGVGVLRKMMVRAGP
jgi:hypothetical protein